MTTMRTLVIATLLATLVCVTGSAPLAHADVNNFIITNFSADETLSNTDKQGALHIVERISLRYTDNNHGILRAIPNSYKGHSLRLHVNRITSDTKAPTKFSTYTQNGNTVLKIGDPNRTVRGAQQYTIDYTVQNVIGFYPDHDELFWDINGDQWQQPSQHVSVTLHLPHDIQLDSHHPSCFAGSTGSREKPCTVTQPNKSTITAATNAPLDGYQTLTLVASFKTGFFQPMGWQDYIRDYAKPVLLFITLPLISLALSLRLWLKRGRDPKGKGTIVPEYVPPTGMSPLEVGTLIDFKTDTRDLTATIIDLALRGYVKIIEQRTDRRFRKDMLGYILELTNADFSKLRTYERTMLEGMFPKPQAGDQIDISAAKNKLYTTAGKIKKDVQQQLTAKDYTAGDLWTTGKQLWLLAGALLLALLIGGSIFGGPLVLGALLAILITVGFAFVMPRRTAKGVAAKEQILGLKLYLKTAEADRIKMLQSPNARYAANHDAPKKTVQLFEKLLPYAIVLGVEQQWAKQFEGLYTSPPDWYAGNWTAFNAGLFASTLSSNFQSSFNSAFTAPGSGTGSGGSAGGGGGGGGGGGW
ncbi:MAG TPA: DUF2207 domain-containing protein [Nevskiaceae bacterium]|nr:DUF2207 domain-containing protein [Nevskiaceae bacterium]